MKKVQYFQRTWLVSLVFAVILATSNAGHSVAHAADDEPRSSNPPGNAIVRVGSLDDTTKAQTLIRVLNSRDIDPKKRSAAAQRLGDLKYLEVRDSLLTALEAEVQHPSPNSFVISAIITSLSKMADSSNLPQIRRVLEVVQASTATWAPHTITALRSLTTRAQERAPSSNPLPLLPPPPVISLVQELVNAVNRQQLSQEAISAFFNGHTKVLSDEVAERLRATEQDPTTPGIVGREAEAIRTLDILLRIKSRIPVLVGEAGVGKSTVAERIAELLQTGALPNWSVYRNELPADTIVIETSPAQLTQLAPMPAPPMLARGMKSFLEAAEAVQRALGRPVIIFIDEIHGVHEAQLEALKVFAEKVDGPRIIGATTHREFLQLISNDRALERRLSPVEIQELTAEQTIQVIEQGWLTQIENRYGVTIPRELLPDLVRMASELTPDLSRPDAQIKFLQDLAIRVGRQHAEQTANIHDAQDAVVTRELAARYAAEVAGMPIDFSNPRALIEYIDSGRMQMLSRVIGQDQLVNLLVDTWQTVLTSNAARAFRTVAILGTTGTGKSYSAELIGEVFLGGGRDRVLTIDANAYQSGGLSLNSLIGAPNGIISSNVTKGILPEFLAGRGKQGGVIIINEIEKAHPDLMRRLMEMMDRGVLTGGDGKEYRLRRHMVVLTSNRGANRIFSNEAGSGLSEEETVRRAARLTESELKQLFVQANSNGSPDDPSRLPPEVVNRIDRWAVAKPLLFSEVVTIANLRVARFLRETHQEYRINFTVDPSVVQAAAKVAYVAADGARPVEKKIDDYLSRVRALIFRNGDTANTDAFTVTAVTDAQGSTLLRVAQGARELGTIDASAPVQFLALHDPRTTELLRSLEANMNREVLGQTEAITTLARAVRARAVRPFDSRPISVLLLGSTGTGKTETAKALAQHLYGNRERAAILNFGEVQHQFDLSRFFSPPRGVQGAYQVGEFEQFLINFPEGGVIVFDEITNMGARLPKPERETLFKSLYAIFQEGTWTNTNGHTYDLSKFAMILTGNQGEELFQGQPNDQLRDSTWSRNRSRAKLEPLLVESGIPEAFVNRIQEVLLMRPLTGEVKEQIARLWLGKILSQFEATYHIKFQVSPGFEARLGNLFFPINRGARGIRDFITGPISSFVGDLLLDNMLEIRGATRENPMNINLSLDVSLPARPWRVPQVTPVTAQLGAVLRLPNGTEVRSTREVEPSSAPRLTTEADARRVAIHEAGHALVNLHLSQVAGPLMYLTIQSAGDFGGYAMYDGEKAVSVVTLRSLLHRMAVSAAGGVAEETAGLPRDAGWSSDLSTMRNLAMKALVKYGLLPGLEFLPLDEKGNPNLAGVPTDVRERLHNASQILINTAINLAKEIMTNPDVVAQRDAVVEGLLDTGFIEPARFAEIVGAKRLTETQIETIEERVTPNEFKAAICNSLMTRP